jgi:hypothetical protein
MCYPGLIIALACWLNHCLWMNWCCEHKRSQCPLYLCWYLFFSKKKRSIRTRPFSTCCIIFFIYLPSSFLQLLSSGSLFESMDAVKSGLSIKLMQVRCAYIHSVPLLLLLAKYLIAETCIPALCSLFIVGQNFLKRMSFESKRVLFLATCILSWQYAIIYLQMFLFLLASILSWQYVIMYLQMFSSYSRKDGCAAKPSWHFRLLSLHNVRWLVMWLTRSFSLVLHRKMHY